MQKPSFVAGLTPASIAAGLLGMLLTGIGTQYFEVVIGLGFLTEHTLAVPAIWALLFLIAFLAFVYVLGRTRLLNRAELLCVTFMMLMSAPLMTQGFWHRIVAVIATNPRDADFGRVDAMNDKLWPHGPNLLRGVFTADGRGEVASGPGVVWSRLEYDAGLTAELPVLRNDEAEAVTVLRVVLPVERDGHRLLSPGEPFMISVLASAQDLGPAARYFCRLYSDGGSEFVPVFESAQATRPTYLHQKGFQRIGVYGFKLPAGLRERLTVEFGLSGTGEVVLADPKFFSVSVLEGIYRGRPVVSESQLAQVPPEQRSGLLVRPDRLLSVAGIKFLLSGYIPVRDWLGPMAVWTSFVVLGLVACTCVNILMRRQWMENERFQMPVGRIPMELIDDGGQVAAAPPLWRNRLLWIGLVATFVWECCKAWSFYNPKVPNLAINVPISTYFTDPGWGGMWTNCRFEVVSIFLAIGMFMELNVLLSFVLGTFLYRLQFLVGYKLGNTNPGFPWGYQQTTGAFLGYAVIVLFFARKYLANLVKAAAGVRPDLASPNEALSYRWALLLLAGTFVGTALWAKWMGMTVLGMLVFFVLLLAMGFVSTRIRVECGTPWGYIVPGNLGLFMMAIGGIPLFGPQAVVFCFIASFMLCPTVFFLIPGAQLEFIEIGRRWQVRPRHLFWTVVVALVGGMVVGGWVFLSNAYAMGGSTHPYGWAYDSKTWYFFSFDQAMTNATSEMLGKTVESGGFDPSWIAMGASAVVTMGLTTLRQLFAGFWFHPLGFVLGSTTGGGFINYIWGSLLAAWLIRWTTLKFGGAVTVRTKLQPIFIGVFVGACLAYLAIGLHAAYLKSIGIERFYGLLYPG